MTYNAGAATGSVPSPTSGLDGTSITLAAPTGLSNPDHDFAGWNDGTSPTDYAANASYPLSSNGAAITLTAEWTSVAPAPVVTGSTNPADMVSFNSEGGSVEATITGANGSSVSLPTPTFASDIFLGWFTSSTGGTSVTSPLILTASSMTLYAHWSTNLVISTSAPKTPPSYRVIGVIRSFTLGTSVLTSALRTQIQRVAALVKTRHYGDVILRGNATLPASTSNRKLARARASAVETYLRQLGVQANFNIEFTVSGASAIYLAVIVYAK